jgi:hypothetical protein
MVKPSDEVGALTKWIAGHPEWAGFYQALEEFAPKTFRAAAFIADDGDGDASSVDLNPSALHTALQLPHRKYLRSLAIQDPDAASALLSLVETVLVALESNDERDFAESPAYNDLYGFSIAGFVRDLEEDEETRRQCLRFVGPRTAILLRGSLTTGDGDMRIGEDFQPLRLHALMLLPGPA